MATVTAVRMIRIIQISLLVSIAVYAMVGEKLAQTMTRDPANTLLHALSVISISVVGATMVVRRTLILPSEAVLKERSDDALALSRWKAGYLFLFALCDVLGLFGLILRISGFTLANVWGFYLGGFLLLILYSPRTQPA